MSCRLPPAKSRKGKEKVGEEEYVDWIKLLENMVTELFSHMNYHDRANLASTCKAWRAIGNSPIFWKSLNFRAHSCDSTMVSSLASRCSDLEKLRFLGDELADSIIFLRARKLRELIGDKCEQVTDATLSVIAARHELLECFEIGPKPCGRITSSCIRQIAFCCNRLTKLRLSRIREVGSDAINALRRHCPHLADLGLLDCFKVDEVALGNVPSLRFLSVACTHVEFWGVVLDIWHKLPKIIGLDVSRTDVGLAVVSTLLRTSQSLSIICALDCPNLEGDTNFRIPRGKSLLAIFTHICRQIASLFPDMRENNIFQDWRNSDRSQKRIDEIMHWLKGILSLTLYRSAKSNAVGLYEFWLGQGAPLLFILMRSSQEDVQERAAAALPYLVALDEHFPLNEGRAAALLRDRGISNLLDLAKSCQEGVQFEAVKAIAYLSAKVNVAKAVVEKGGVDIVASLARSMDRRLARVAIGGLWNLSSVEEHKGVIAEAGGVKAIVDLIIKWPDNHKDLRVVAGALANMLTDYKCRKELALANGVHALVMLARNCQSEDVLKQVLCFILFRLKYRQSGAR